MAGTKEVFVGRAREMGILTAALSDAVDGRGRIVMLGGAPGVGKTRIAEELASRAKTQGGRVFRGGCPEQAGVPPYWPWTQVLRTYLDPSADEDIQRDMGASAGVLAEIAPEILPRIPSLNQPTRPDNPESARFRLFDAVSTFLRTAARIKPVTVILEDLQWADRPSLLLLEFMAGSIADSRLLVVGTYRDVELNRRHPLAETLGDLSRETSFERLQVRTLDRDEVRQLIEATSTIQPTDSVVDAVFERTEGNALFVSEILRLLDEEAALNPDRIGGDAWGIRLPEGVREVIGRRLNRLSDDCNRVLTNAALLGRQFRLGVLEVLMETYSTDQLVDLLDEALGAAIVEEVPSEAGLFQFTHSVIQETLAIELSHTRAVRVHARIAHALEAHYGDRADDHAGELAEHFAEAETVVGAEKFVHYASFAGWQSLALFLHDEAAQWFERALAAMGPEDDQHQRAEIMFGLGVANHVFAAPRRRHQRAWEMLSRAFQIFDELGDRQRAVEVAKTQIGAFELDGPARMTERALQLVESGSEDAGWLHARHAIFLRDELGRLDESLEHLTLGLAIADGSGNKRMEARLLAHLTQHHEALDQLDQMVESGQRAAEIARAIDDPETEQRAQQSLSRALVALGRLDEATQAAVVSVDASDRAKGVTWRVVIRNLLSRLHVFKGDWKRALEVVAEADALIPSARELELRQAMVRAITEGLPGRSGQLFDPEAADRLIMEPLEIVVVAWLFGSHSILDDQAVNAARRLADNRAPDERRLGNTVLGAHAIETGDSNSASERYETLAPYSGRFDEGTGTPYDLILALLASTSGGSRTADTHFDAAVTGCRTGGFLPMLAESGFRFADYLLAQNRSGDIDKAVGLHSEAAAVSSELEMKPLKERLAALEGRLTSAESGMASYPDDLSEREVDVLRLLAAGQSNQQIADQLFISRFTVVRHVTNIYAKIGASNRAEATAYAYLHGLAG